MTRPLRIVREDEDVLGALRQSLAGGPAVLVSNRASTVGDLPANVEQRVALVVETSGTTGTPKRVALSADAMLASAAASESALGGPGQWVLALPTHYIAGLNVLTRSIAAGFDPVAVRGDRFTADAFVRAARGLTEKVRFTSLVPAQLATLLDDEEAVGQLREFARVLVGGQATPPALLERATAAGIHVTRTYGSSETCGGCVYDGMPIGTTSVRVEDGEIWLGGPTLAVGYLGDPALTAARFVVDDLVQWFRTADAGTWDGERLVVTGRRDDVLISGGLKVSSGEIERVVRAQGGFSDAVVVIADNVRWGESAVVFTRATQDPAEAIAAVVAELGVAARPTVIVVDELPLLPSGKVDLRALRRLAAE